LQPSAFVQWPRNRSTRSENAGYWRAWRQNITKSDGCKQLFWQIHRSFVVAVKHIASVSRDDDGALWLSLRGHDARLPVSQRFQFRFKGM
jgi:hypothetical protein